MQKVFIDDQVYALIQATGLRNMGGVGVIEFEQYMSTVHFLLQLQVAVYTDAMIADSTLNCPN